MYLYLYAPFLRGKKYARDLALLEGRVTDFGISGKVAQLSQFLKFPAAIKEFGLKRLATVVLVGDDALLEEAVNHFALTNVVLGYVPMGEGDKNRYGELLRIPKGPDAADVLAARRIARLDLGRIGEQRYFFGKVWAAGVGIEVHSPTFSLMPKGYTLVEIVNADQGHFPENGRFTIRVTPFAGRFVRKPTVSTTLQLASCRLKAPRPTSVRLPDGGGFRLPLQVDIVRGAIRMIMGRRVKRMKN